MEKNSRHEDEPEDEMEFPAMPVGPDGGIDAAVAAGMIGKPVPVPVRDPANFVCLRDCQHYWHLETMAQASNPEEIWEELGIPEPRQHHHVCLVNPGYETAFADDNAYSCSKWSPMYPSELVQLQTRRESYYARHPEHAPTTSGERPPWWHVIRLWRWYRSERQLYKLLN